MKLIAFILYTARHNLPDLIHMSTCHYFWCQIVGLLGFMSSKDEPFRTFEETFPLQNAVLMTPVRSKGPILCIVPCI